MNYSNEVLISYYDRFGVDGKFTRSAVRYPQKQNEKRFGSDLAKQIGLATNIAPDRAIQTLMSVFDGAIDMNQFMRIPKPVVISLP